MEKLDKNQKIIIALVLSIAVGILLIEGVSLVSGQQQSLGVYKADTCVNLIQTCGTCTFNNITSLLSPNSTTLLSSTAMTKSGTEYTYQFCDTSTHGTYIVNGFGDLDGTNTVWAYDFIISATGKDLTSAKATSYVIIFIIAFIVFLGFLLIGIYLPSNNKSDEFTGYIIAVNNLKYVKILSFAFSYLVALFISYFAWMVCYAYLDMDFVTNIFKVLFYAETILLLPMFIIGSWIMISNLVRDAKIGEMLSRGLKTRGTK